jgi:hypothetical protein
MRCGARGICKVQKNKHKKPEKAFTVKIKKGIQKINFFEQPCYKYYSILLPPSYHRYACRDTLTSIKHHPDQLE